MTIREVEQRTGLERATVRFYEKEELLTPQRLENGYRDYSEEDVATLLRIKLLRELDLSLEDIRALQSGEQALPDTLARQLSALERRLEETARTRDTCRAIRDEGVSYRELDATKYLNRVFPQSSERVPDRDKPKPPYCPWRRYFARMLDLSIYGLFWTALMTLVLHVNAFDRPPILEWIDSLAALLMMLFLEPLWLRLWGTTPGKALFGLRIEREDGRRMEYFDGLDRTVRVIWQGMGFQIPIYSLVRLWKSYNLHAESEMPWDEDFRYEVKDGSFLRGLGFVLAMAAILTATVFMALAGRIPPNRGELTVEEFAENYNFQMRYYDVQDNTYLGEDGKWLSQMYDGSVIAHIGENPEFSYTQENGRVTAVHITQTGDENYLYSLPLSQLRFAAVALAAGEGEGLLLHMDAIAEAAQEVGLSSGSMSVCGITLTSEVEYEGYEPVAYGLWPLDGVEPSDCWYSLSYTLKYTE